MLGSILRSRTCSCSADSLDVPISLSFPSDLRQDHPWCHPHRLSESRGAGTPFILGHQLYVPKTPQRRRINSGHQRPHSVSPVTPTPASVSLIPKTEVTDNHPSTKLCPAHVRLRPMCGFLATQNASSRWPPPCAEETEHHQGGERQRGLWKMMILDKEAVWRSSWLPCCDSIWHCVTQSPSCHR